MSFVTLVEIPTKDNLIHQGIFAEPAKKSTTAILWVHGLSGNFYGNVPFINVLTETCVKNGIAFASFNTRGHDVVTGIKIGKTRVVGGAGIERFEECVYDIDASVSFLVQRGFTKIILVGHSTGANKVCFYAGTQHDPRITGVVLASPVCDRLVSTNHVSWVAKIFLKIFQAVGLGNTFIPFISPYPVTPNRALSLSTRSSEDVFDYDDTEKGLKVFGNIIKPLLVVLGEQDESLDRPAFVIKAVYDKKANAKQYTSLILKETDHGFTEKEKEFIKEILTFIKRI